MVVPICCRVAGFHSFAVPSVSPVARMVPDELNAIPLTEESALFETAMVVPICFLVTGFHSFTVPSSAVARTVPEELKETP